MTADGAAMLPADDWQFMEMWRGLTPDQRSEHPGGFERYRKLTPWVGESTRRAGRGQKKLNGHEHEHPEVDGAAVLQEVYDYLRRFVAYHRAQRSPRKSTTSVVSAKAAAITSQISKVCVLRTTARRQTRKTKREFNS